MYIEERLNTFAQMLSQLHLKVNGNNPDRPQPMASGNRTTEDRILMVEIPEFDGVCLNPEDYIEWKNTIERYFEYKETPPDQSCIMAKVN